jgi:hypothetical protein
VFLICTAVLEATMFGTHGVPDFLGGSGMFKAWSRICSRGVVPADDQLR